MPSLSLRAGLVCLLLASSASAITWPDTAERIERGATSADLVVRRAAARDVSSLGATRAKPIVLKLLADADIDVRLLAAEAAARLRIRDAVDVALGWLGEREPRLRVAACVLARALPDRSRIPTIARALGDPDAQVRAAAAAALGAHVHGDIVAPLLGRVDDPSPLVRVEVANALAASGDERGVVPLLGKVQDGAPEFRQAVARALGDLGDARGASGLSVLTRDPVLEVRLQAIESLSRIPSAEAVSALALAATDRVVAVRNAAVASLGNVRSERATSALLNLLVSTEDASLPLDASPNRLALVAQGARAIPLLRAALERSDSLGLTVVNGICWVLGELGAKGTDDAVINALRQGRVHPAAALHGLSAPSSLRVALEHVSSKVPLVRTEALAATSRLLDPSQPDGRALEPLALLLDDASLGKSERSWVIKNLGRTASPKATPYVLRELAKGDATLRLAAVDALGFIPGRDSETALLGILFSDDATLRFRAANSLSRIGSPWARSRLLEAFSDDGTLDRGASLLALSGMSAREPDDKFRSALGAQYRLSGFGERDAFLLALVRAGGKFDGAAAGEDERRVLAVVGDPRPFASDAAASVRSEAMWHLGTMPEGKSAEAEALLERGLRDADGNVVANAAAALGRRAKVHTAPDHAAGLLCALSSDPRPLVRVNSLLSQLMLGIPCKGDAEGAARDALVSDPEELVRRTAAQVLSARAQSGSPEDLAALRTCSRRERVSTIAKLCRSGQPASTQAPRSTDSLTIFVTNDEGAVKPRTPYALRHADGLIRVGVSDRRGVVFEPTALPGEVSLVRIGPR